MKVLFIGGTGIISTACSELASKQGIELLVLTRGQHKSELPAGVTALRGSIDDPQSVTQALGDQKFDVVVDWIAFAPEHIERDLDLFRGRTGQYVFISSASCYQKPVQNYLITESTPLENPFWEYSQKKIACEERLWRAFHEEQFPVTVVRPSLTYGETLVPLAINSWAENSFTVVDRMLRGKPVIVPGDGSSLWVVTHNTDFAKGFVGLLGNPKAIGEAFHITTDEVLTWNQIFSDVAEAAGVAPKLLHIPSDFIIACLPSMQGTLIGDKACSVAFDNSKIKKFVPGFKATVPFAEGIKRTIQWFNADDSRKKIDQQANITWDKLIDAYSKGLDEGIRSFASTRTT